MGELAKVEQAPAWVAEVKGASGFETVTQEDLPRQTLKIAQGSSEVMKDPAKRIAGLELGAFYVAASGKEYGKNPRIIMLHAPIVSYRLKKGYAMDAETVKVIDGDEWERSYRAGSEWAEKNDGKKYLRTQEGYAVTETRTIPALMLDDLEAGVVLFPLSGMGLKIARPWTAKAFAKTFPGRPGEVLPAWLTVWELGTAYVPSDGGYYALTMPKDLGYIPDSARDIAAAAFAMIQKMRRDFKAADLAGEDDSAQATTAKSEPVAEDEIPF